MFTYQNFTKMHGQKNIQHAKSFLTGSFFSSDLSWKGACVEALLFDNRRQYRMFTAIKILNFYDNFEIQMRLLTAALLTVYVLWDTTTYVLWDTTTYVLWDTTTYVLWDTTAYVLWDTTAYVLWDTTTYVLWDTTTYVLWVTTTYVLWDTTTYQLVNTWRIFYRFPENCKKNRIWIISD